MWGGWESGGVLSRSPGVREPWGRGARAGSPRHIARAVPYIMDVNEGAVAAAFRAARVRRMIHGHTHRPGVHEMRIDGAPAERIVLGAWYEQGSHLASAQGKYELHALPRPASSAAAPPAARGRVRSFTEAVA